MRTNPSCFKRYVLRYRLKKSPWNYPNPPLWKISQCFRYYEQAKQTLDSLTSSPSKFEFEIKEIS